GCATGHFLELEGNAADDPVLGKREDLVARLRPRHAEGDVRAVLGLPDGHGPSGRATGEDRLAVLAEAHVGLVLEAHEEHAVLLGPDRRASGELLSTLTRVDR